MGVKVLVLGADLGKSRGTRSLSESFYRTHNPSSMIQLGELAKAARRGVMRVGYMEPKRTSPLKCVLWARSFAERLVLIQEHIWESMERRREET